MKRLLALVFGLCAILTLATNRPSTAGVVQSPTFLNLVAAVPIYTGSFVAPTGATITDNNISTAECVGINSSGQYVYATNCITSITGSGGVTVSAGPTPSVSFTAGPTFTSVATTTLTASGAISGATLTGTGLTPGDCVQAGTGGLLTVTGSGCGSSGGSVNSVTASLPLLSSGGTSPNISVSPNPVFTSTITAKGFVSAASGSSGGSSTTYGFGADGSSPANFNFQGGTSGSSCYYFQSASAAVTYGYLCNTGWNLGSSVYGPTSAVVNGPVTTGLSSFDIWGGGGNGALIALGSSSAYNTAGNTFIQYAANQINFGCFGTSQTCPIDFYTGGVGSAVTASLSSAGVLNLTSLSASSSVCTDGSKNLTTSSCASGVPVACTTSSTVPCYYTWTCTISSSSNSCSTTQGVPASSNCTATFNSSPVVTSSVSYPVAGGGIGVASGTISYPAGIWLSLASTTLTVHVVSGNAVNSNFAENGNGTCL